MNEIEKAQLAKETAQCFLGLNGSLKNFPGLLKQVIEEKVWLGRLHNGRFFKLDSLRQLVTMKPLEGWGQDPAKIEAIIKDNPEVLALWREEMKQEPGSRNDLLNNIKEVKPATGGTSKAYTVSRLKRESPELFAQVVAGELSANAAAIKAGFRKVRTPMEQVLHWWGKVTPEERLAFRDRINTDVAGELNKNGEGLQ